MSENGYTLTRRDWFMAAMIPDVLSGHQAESGVEHGGPFAWHAELRWEFVDAIIAADDRLKAGKKTYWDDKKEEWVTP